jgi:hypothetical protein
MVPVVPIRPEPESIRMTFPHREAVAVLIKTARYAAPRDSDVCRQRLFASKDSGNAFPPGELLGRMNGRQERELIYVLGPVPSYCNSVAERMFRFRVFLAISDQHVILPGGNFGW